MTIFVRTRISRALYYTRTLADLLAFGTAADLNPKKKKKLYTRGVTLIQTSKLQTSNNNINGFKLHSARHTEQCHSRVMESDKNINDKR